MDEKSATTSTTTPTWHRVDAGQTQDQVHGVIWDIVQTTIQRVGEVAGGAATTATSGAAPIGKLWMTGAYDTNPSSVVEKVETTPTTTPVVLGDNTKNTKETVGHENHGNDAGNNKGQQQQAAANSNNDDDDDNVTPSLSLKENE